MRRLAARARGRSPEEIVNIDAPYGYTEDGEPKRIDRVTIIDPDGNEPTKTIHVKNW